MMIINMRQFFIYLAELLYRANPSEELLKKYNSLIQETAEFMYSFATYEEEHDRYAVSYTHLTMVSGGQWAITLYGWHSLPIFYFAE